jgi:hypothetical protein
MIQPGQIDYQKQLDSLKDLPVSADSIEYLTNLSRNPGSPFVRFLVESRLEQLTKALQNQAGSQAQENAPQGTISDRIQQAAGLAALQTGQQRQAAEQMQQQASQARIPVPEGITQPQAQAEPDYGVASAPVDSEMFNFAPGGIVTFANPEKEKKQLVKDEEEERLRKQTEMYVAAAQEAAKQRAIDAANAPPKEVPTEDPAMGMSGGPAKVNPLSRMLLDPLKAAASGISNLVSRPTPQTMMLDKGEAPTLAPMAAPMAGPAADTESQKLTRLAANPPAAQNMNPALQPNRNVPPPPPAVNTGINTGKPPAPPAPPAASATAGIETLINQMYNMPERNKFGQLINEARANMVTTPQSDLIKQEQDLQKALGIGTLDTQQMKMYEDNKARQAKVEAGRGQRDFMAQLAAYSRPGANWSQVMERDIANKSAALMEDERFANAQNKLLTDIQTTAEARRVGTASAVRAAAAKEKETREKMLDLIMRLTGDDAKIAQAILGDTLKTAVSLYGYDVQARGQDLQYKANMAQANNRNEFAAAKLELAQEKLKQTIAQAGVDSRLKLSNSKPYVDLDKQINGIETRIRYETNPDGTPKNPEKMGKLTTDLANLRTRQADLASQILGTGGISTLPASAPPPGAVREVKKP